MYKTFLFVLTLGQFSNFFFTNVHAKEKEFDVNKLIEYNSLATCIAQIHQDFAKCNTNGAEKAKSAIGQLDLGEEWGKRLKCCGMWKLRDCWMKSANVKCSKEQADQIYSLPSLFMAELATECRDYTPESGKCSVPMWMMASVGFAGLFLVILFIFGCYVCVKKLRVCKNNSDLERRNRSLKNQQLSLNGKKIFNETPIDQDMDKKPFTNGGNHPAEI